MEEKKRILGTGRPRRAGLLAAALAAIPFILLLCLFRPHWETNDDPGMMLIMAGRAVTDRPSELTLWTNVGFPLLLKSLYGAFPRFPWYPSLFFLLMPLAVAAIFRTLLRLRAEGRGPAPLVVATCLLTGLGIYEIVAVQFTKVAFLLGLAGGLTSLPYVLAGADGKPRFPDESKWPTVALWTLGALVRFESLVMAVLLAGMTWAIFGVRGSAVHARRAIALSLAALAAVGVCQLASSLYLSTRPGWAEFQAFNALDSRFFDFQYVSSRDAAPLLGEVGWSRNDFELFWNFFYIDKTVYTPEALTTLLRNAHVVTWPRLWDALRAFAATSLTRSALLFLALIGWRLTRENRERLLLAFAGCLAIALGLGLFLKSVDRVTSQLWLYLPVLAVLLWSLQSPKGERRWTGPLAGGAAAAIALVLLLKAGPRLAPWPVAQERFLSDLRSLKERPERIYVLWGDGMNIELTKVFSTLEEFENLFLIHVTSKNPLFADRNRLLGDEGPPLNLVRDKRFVLITPEARLPLLQTLFRERAGLDTGYRLAFQGKTFSGYQLVERAPGAASGAVP